MPSIGVDNIGRTECLPVHVGHEKQMLGIACMRAPAQVVRNSEPKRATRLSTNRSNVNVQPATQQAAEHERRGECIFRACSKCMLACTEFHAVRSPIGGQRKRPGDISGTIANQKKQLVFQLLND